MKTASVIQIKTITKKLSLSKKQWHFHILTPDCQLNDTGKYALVLENVTDTEPKSDLQHIEELFYSQKK
jgi:hypothetical protein